MSTIPHLKGNPIMNKVHLTQNVCPRTSEVVRENDVWPRFLRGGSIASINNLPPEGAFQRQCHPNSGRPKVEKTSLSHMGKCVEGLARQNLFQEEPKGLS